MRYNEPIFFQKVTPGEYDADSGNYGEDTIAEEKRDASITDAGTETLRLFYGELKQGCKTIRIQTPYKKPFDSIRIGRTIYRVDFARRQRFFVVSEVQSNVNQN